MTTQESKPIASTRRAIGVLSIDVKTVSDALRATKIGDTVAYSTLEQLIGRSIRGKNYWILLSARKRLLSQDSMLFGTVSKVGLKRLSDSEIIAASRDELNRVHRGALRGLRKISSVQDYNSLPHAEKVNHGVTASALSVLSYMTKEAQLKRIEKKIEKSPVTLPLHKTLEAFSE